KIWYLANFIPLDNNNQKLIQRSGFQFVWNKKPDPIKRNIMFNSTQQGGIGICNVKCKSTALLLTHVKEIINLADKTWFPFARYWLGFRLRGENPALDSNSLPRTEKMPYFYEKCFIAYTIIKGENPDLDWKKELSKTLYTKLLEMEIEKPHVEIKRDRKSVV